MISDSKMELIRGAEERLVNVWPAPSTMLMDGWVVRFANGYSSRANSASAVVPGVRISDAMLGTIERLYREAGLPPTVRITPLAHPDTKAMLLARGYRIKDEASTMLIEREAFQQSAMHENITIADAADRDWIEGISVRQESSKRSPDHLAAIVSKLRVTSGFATLEISGHKLGFGMGAIDRGWAEIGSIMLDANQRGKGLGRAIMTSLLAWASKKGAERAFLQVDVTNVVAMGLYESLGFRELYRYRTLTLD